MKVTRSLLLSSTPCTGCEWREKEIRQHTAVERVRRRQQRRRCQQALQAAATYEDTHPIHAQLSFVSIVSALKFHSGLALRQLHALVALKHHSAHPAKAAEDLIQVLLSNITRKACDMKEAADKRSPGDTSAL